MAYCESCRAKLPEAKDSEIQHPFSVESFLDSGEFTDFEFRVKPEDHPDIPERRFRVHKLFLAMRNEVFHAMFFGDLAEKSEVVITDVHPDGFDLLLRYLYSGKPKMKSIDDALHARFAAKKYLVQGLVDACGLYIEKNLKAERLCSFIDYFMQSREPEIDAIAETLLTSSKAPDILTSKEFNVALEETIRYIVERIRKVSEDSVTNAVFGWAQEQCVKSLESESPLEVKAIMRTFFPKLRFLTMTAEEFVVGPGSWGLLEDAENLALLRNIVKSGSQPLPEGFCNVTDDRF
ncbi:BTB/POZ domain-containing protein 6-like [Dermacentor andersoni]|uniref:BTB/POZ domain-containing protein 6-like n=1 Tax=Dermacentor andersoni TaxID=34620 RepID=UPI0021557B9E|nr:BTB/POZ domain-containing protein 6-like [Dermacentor andersoni]